jgi:hypothetical protein
VKIGAAAWYDVITSGNGSGHFVTVGLNVDVGL